MVAKKTALEHLSQIVAEHPHSPASMRVTVTVGELRDLKSRIDLLTDTVVGAAALYAGELDGPEASYVAEGLHLTATELVDTTPRLKGAYMGGDL